MVKLSIRIREDQRERLRRLSARRRRPISELMRDCLDQFLGAETRELSEARTRALNAAGRFSSGRQDISSRHDDYLVEAFGGE